ncbi:hypothetical protein COLO4_31477 [Corchorus olitorius]|uniref:CASP-like protein n=1 Tax=Corchorus olitorius TaxID=93759 RepID=A0A1R3H4G7_9ROSI|nr:hypothetical protein COLO4_31477 [Corchorus olitorius]
MAKTKRVITILLRLLALGACISATVVMITSHDSADVLNMKFSAKYTNTPTFKYYVIAEAIAAGYSLIVLFLSSKSLCWRLIVILDVVMAMLLTSSISAALAIAQVGKKGNSHAGWLPVCDQVPKFCDHVTGSLVSGFVAAIVYLVLNLYSLHAVLSPLFPNMVCEALSFAIPLFTNLTSKDAKRDRKHSTIYRSIPRIRCSSYSAEQPIIAEKPQNDHSLTGTAYDFERATTSLTGQFLLNSKKVTIVRHGLSTWNEEGRIQGSSNSSVLTEAGVKQAERCRQALANMHFDQCFASPISRAKNLEAVDARVIYPKEYVTWREDPANFYVNGVYPTRRLWATAREAWREILLTPGEHFLVVTHKSILRALICTALGLPPERFRAIDVNNGGISTFSFNKRGEAMLQSLNMTAHMYSDHVYIS